MSITTTIELTNGIAIEIPQHVIADLTHEEVVECRAAAVRALVERVEEIRATR